MIVVAAIGRHESLQSVKTFMKPPLQERHRQGSLEEPRKKLESSIHDFNQEQRKWLMRQLVSGARIQRKKKSDEVLEI